jgi:HEAT repeat protein
MELPPGGFARLDPTSPLPQAKVMAQPRRRFGPLFRITAVAALVILVSLPFWQTAGEQWSAWMLSRRLRDPAEGVRREAADQLVRLGPPATSWVIAAMRDSNPVVRRLATSILPRTAPEKADRVVAALRTAARDSDPSVRAAAVEQMAAFVTGGPLSTGPESRELALGALRDSLRDAAPQVREAAGSTLWNLGPLARPAAGDLDRALDGPDRTLRVIAADALLKISPNESRARVAAAMTALVVDYSDPTHDWRAAFNHHRAANTLKNAIGEEALATRLGLLLNDPDPRTRQGAMFDLTVHCPDAEVLTRLLKDAMASFDGNIRCDAALFLVGHRPELASKALDCLASEIVNPVEGTSFFSHLIDQLKRESPRSLGQLARRLADELPKIRDGERRIYVAMALGEIGPEAQAAVPALLENADSSDRLVATRAIESLAKIDSKSAAKKLPVLLELMNPGVENAVRLVALAALRDIGPSATVAVPALLKTVDEEDIAISTAAIEALTKIDPPAAAAIKQSIETGVLRPRDEP